MTELGDMVLARHYQVFDTKFEGQIVGIDEMEISVYFEHDSETVDFYQAPDGNFWNKQRTYKLDIG